MASVSGTFTVAQSVSSVFFLRAGETARVTGTLSGTATVALQRSPDQPTAAWVDEITFTATTSGTDYKNTTGRDQYLRMLCRAVSGSYAYTLADIAGDQVLEEWRAADGTLAFRITDRGAYDPFTGAVNADAYGTDLAGVQQAITDAAGGTLLFPPGYSASVAGELTVATKTRILGYGATITATALGSAKAGLKVTASGSRVEGLKVVGPSVAAYVLDECGIWFYGTSGTPLTDCVAKDCEVTSVGSYGILFEYSNRSSAQHNYVHDCGYMGITALSCIDWSAEQSNRVSTITPGTSSNAYGIYVGKRLEADLTPTKWRISKNYVTDVALWEGIDTHGGSYGEVEGNIVTGCKVGIQCGQDTWGNVPDFTKVIGNIIGKGGLTTTQLRGISVGGSSIANAKGMVVADNTVYGMGGADGSSQLLAALLVQYTDGAKIDNNTLFDCEQNGIMIDADADAISVTNNTVRGVTNRTGNSAALRFNVVTTGVCTGNYLDAGTEYALYMNAACPALRMDDTNVFVSSASPPVVNPANCGRGYTMQGSVTTDIGSISDGTGSNLDITVTGAAIGDFVQVGCSLDVESLTISAAVRATNTVEVRLQNETGAPVDLASATYTAKVTRA